MTVVDSSEDYGLIIHGLEGGLSGSNYIDDRPFDDISREQFKYLADNFARIANLFEALFTPEDWGLITNTATIAEDYGSIV